MYLHIKCLDKGIDKVVSGLQAIEILREIQYELKINGFVYIFNESVNILNINKKQ